MGKASRNIVSAAVAVSFLLSVAACGLPTLPESPPAEDQSQAQTDEAQNDQALAAYVEAEKATIPDILAQYPGVYADVAIDGSQADSSGDDGIPAGTYWVVYFDYTFANAMDWTATSSGLEDQRPALDDACKTIVFPAMRSAGITGPLGAVYSYSDVNSAAGTPEWTHTCTE